MLCLCYYASLLFVKTVLGVILLKTAWNYHDRMQASKQETSIESTSGLSVHADLHKRHDLTTESYSSGDNEHIQRKPKSRSLSDIERFTLCSNRIV